MYNIYGGWAVDWMGETDTFGNNGTKKKKKAISLARLLSIITSGPDQFIIHVCKENLGFAIILSEIMKTENLTGMNGNQ